MCGALRDGAGEEDGAADATAESEPEPEEVGLGRASSSSVVVKVCCKSREIRPRSVSNSLSSSDWAALRPERAAAEDAALPKAPDGALLRLRLGVTCEGAPAPALALAGAGAVALAPPAEVWAVRGGAESEP